MTLNWLNIGCGHDYREGWLNLDKFNQDRLDVQVDLERGLPFADDTFDYVYASHVLQRIRAPANLVMDVHRILKTGGRFEICVPYGIVRSPYLRAFFLNTMNSFVIPRGLLSHTDFQLPSKPMFKKLKQETTKYGIPFAWHLDYYLGIYIAYLPLWKRKEIHWILEKI